MTVDEVYQLLEVHKNERGMLNWNKGNHALKSFGIGLTQLKKLAKQMGRNRELAAALWQEPCFDCLQLALLIEEPKKVSESEVEQFLPGIDDWMLSHVFVQNVMAKLPFVVDLAASWRLSSEEIKRRCGFGVLYYLAKDKKKTEDAYYFPILDTIESALQQEENLVRDAMNNALIGIGQRSKALNVRALEVARSIGKVEVDYGDNSCEALDGVKHLSMERLQNKWK